MEKASEAFTAKLSLGKLLDKTMRAPLRLSEHCKGKFGKTWMSGQHVELGAQAGRRMREILFERPQFTSPGLRQSKAMATNERAPIIEMSLLLIDRLGGHTVAKTLVQQKKLGERREEQGERREERGERREVILVFLINKRAAFSFIVQRQCCKAQNQIY